VTEGSGTSPDRGVADALRTAVERTLELAGRPASSATLTRERAMELLDEVARRGREARDDLARRGVGAGEELVRRIEQVLRTRTNPKAED
jgi:hypothetical protein